MPQNAAKRTDHAITPEEGRVSNRKFFSNPLAFHEKPSLRETNPRVEGEKLKKQTGLSHLPASQYQ